MRSFFATSAIVTICLMAPAAARAADQQAPAYDQEAPAMAAPQAPEQAAMEPCEGEDTLALQTVVEAKDKYIKALEKLTKQQSQKIAAQQAEIAELKARP